MRFESGHRRPPVSFGPALLSRLVLAACLVPGSATDQSRQDPQEEGVPIPRRTGAEQKKGADAPRFCRCAEAWPQKRIKEAEAEENFSVARMSPRLSELG